VHVDDVITIHYDESLLDTIEPIELPVVYEDDDCVVINKPAGVLTHSRGGFSTEGTVASWLRSRLREGELSGDRGGIVHRLDRATSGVLICAKHTAALSWLQQQFANRAVQKTYFAVVSGHLPHEHAAIDMPIERDPRHPKMFHAAANGKPATTEYWVRGQNSQYSLVELHPHTGRTHQLRVHLREIGHAIVGDPLYSSEPADRLYLHAAKLEIILPSGKRMVFEAPVPAAFYEKVGLHG
jgi:23S rRNA pseudouridine1911/1915/1917 synthase